VWARFVVIHNGQSQSKSQTPKSTVVITYHHQASYGKNQNSDHTDFIVAQLYLDATVVYREPVVPHWDRSGIYLSIYHALIEPLAISIHPIASVFVRLG